MNYVVFLSVFLSAVFLTSVRHDANTDKKIPLTHFFEDTAKPKSDSDMFMCIYSCDFQEATIEKRKWNHYLSTQLASALDTLMDTIPTGCYNIIIKFMINTEGFIQDVSAVKFDNPILAKIAVDVIKRGPQWQPEKQNGKLTCSYRTQPFNIIIENDPEIKKQPTCDTSDKNLLL